MPTAHPNYGMSFASILPDLPLPEPSGIADEVLYLAFDLSRAVTGTQLTVDKGSMKVRPTASRIL